MSVDLSLQVTASVMALLGTWMIRKPGRWMPLGFVAWLVSNPAAMVFMAMHGHWWFFCQHLMFFLFALESVWHWIVKPGLDGLGEK